MPADDHPIYRAETIAGHDVPHYLGTRDAHGLSALGDFTLLVASRSGRYIYVADTSILRIDQATMRVETISGMDWPGDVDGAADVAQYSVNVYQGGGIALSPDESFLYFVGSRHVRKVDLLTGEGFSLTPPELDGVELRGLAMGPSGLLYLSGWGDVFYVVTPDSGAVETRTLDLSEGWGNGAGQAPGFIAVDETRGWVYGLDRNRNSGALYRWPLEGGSVQLLNSGATGGRDPIQYLSDGPVENLDMANPAAMTIDSFGFVYIGAGDGRTFRRYHPDTQIVESLCAVVGPEAAEGRFEWCIGDGARNQLFGTWPHFLSFDDAGNGYFAYTVWPRLVRLRREN